MGTHLKVKNLFYDFIELKICVDENCWDFLTNTFRVSSLYMLISLIILYSVVQKWNLNFLQWFIFQTEDGGFIYLAWLFLKFEQSFDSFDCQRGTF